MSSNQEFQTVDLAWFRHHLLDDILPLWQAAITDTGLFHCHFDYAWQPEPKSFGTLVSQTRLIYNFAQGFALTGEQIYGDAVESGARFLRENFWDEEFGGWVKACNSDGIIVDDSKDSYGHAFVIFGLAHAFQATGDPKNLNALQETWSVMGDRFRDEHGGYRYFMSRDFQHTEELRSQNPLMHLFEALLAAGDITGMGELHREACNLAEFILGQLMRPQPRVLPEVYSPDWKPLPADQEGRLDIGHAFEWAFLLSSAAERGLSDSYLGEAENFLDYGLRLGYDSDSGGIYSPVDPDGQILNKRKGWWEQCETVRALLRFIHEHGRLGLHKPLQQTISFIQNEFLDSAHKGWYLSREPGESPAMQSKGHEAKLDYHVVGMCMEAIKIAKGTSEKKSR